MIIIKENNVENVVWIKKRGDLVKKNSPEYRVYYQQNLAKADYHIDK